MPEFPGYDGDSNLVDSMGSDWKPSAPSAPVFTKFEAEPNLIETDMAKKEGERFGVVKPGKGA